MAYLMLEAVDYGNGGYKVAVVGSILILMQILMVVGRLLGRRIQNVWLGIDDYVLISATVFTIALCVVSAVFPRIAGVSDWSLQNHTSSKTFGQASVAWLVLYGVSVALSKLAILLLYLRVFTTQMRAFTIALILIGLVVVGTGIANTLAAIFQCSPVPYAWDKSMKPGKCINELAFARFMAIPNVVDGFVMLVMPLPLVWRLDLAIQQKIALTATFLHGIIGFAASVSRLAILFQSNPATDTGATAVAWTIWTINEPANYIIAACLPTLRPIFVRILPEKMFVLSRKRDSSGHAKTLGGSGTVKKVTWSWPKGRMTPKISLVSRGASRLSGPWDQSTWEIEPVVRGREGKREVTVHEREAGSPC